MEASTSAVRLFSRVVKRQRLPSQATRSFSSCGCLRSASAADDRYPDAARSSFLRTTTKDALAVKGIKWQEPVEEEPQDARGDLIGKDVEEMLGASGGSKEGRQTKKMNMYQAVRDAMAITLAKDDSAVVFGEDVAFGGVFRCTMGLAEEFGPTRVFNTPLTEQGIAGFGIGLASMGQTAIAEIQFADYIFPAFDQLVNEAAKFRFRSGGGFDVGKLTVRAPCGAVGHGGLYHSQSPEAFFQHAAGLKVVVPRSPLQAKGLLLASIDTPDPVVFLEPKVLYRSSNEQVPLSSYHLPLGRAEVLTTGSDLTLISYGTPIYTCERALAMLKDPPAEVAHLVPKDLRDLKVELIDLRTICPLDAETLCKSVEKTGRAVVVHEAAQTGGVASEVASLLQTHSFSRLEAPIKRVCGWDTPFPLAFEKFYVPDAIRVLDAIIETAKY